MKIHGELVIKRGLQRRARKRTLVIDQEMKGVLERLLKLSQREYVFTSPQDRSTPLGPWVLEEQMRQIRKRSRLILMPTCTLCVILFSPRPESTRPPLHCSMSPDTITLRPRCAMYTHARLRSKSCLRAWRICSSRRSASGARSRCKIRCSWKCPHPTTLLSY